MDKAGSRFIAITDPGSKMQQVAEADRFRHIFFGPRPRGETKRCPTAAGHGRATLKDAVISKLSIRGLPLSNHRMLMLD